MMADDAQLLAYVDGALTPEEHKKLALLRASNVDFADAFAQQPLPPVPETLRLNIDEMVRAHRAGASSGAPPGVNDAAVPKNAEAPPVRSRLRGVPV